MNFYHPGYLQTSDFSTGFANDKYTSAVSNASVGLVTIWTGVWWSQKYSADDASTTFSILFRRKTLRKRWESWQILWRRPPWMRRWWS